MASLLIIETVPRAVNPIDAHVRNAHTIAKELRQRGWNVDLLFTEESSRLYQKKYDLIVISYATPYPLIKDIDKIVEQNKDTTWGWLTNEYNLRPNGWAYTQFKAHRSFVLTNFEIGSVNYSCFDAEYSVNLNPLMFNDYPKTKKTHNIIYYGTYRVDRANYFHKYLDEQVYLSTSSKNHKKFLHIGCTAKPIQKFSWQKPALLNFRYSLYIEDSFTHNHFNNLANRYYESLACHSVLLFDQSCLNTLEKTGIKNYEPFVIKSKHDFAKFDEKNYEDLYKIQLEWRNNIVKEQKATIEGIEKVLNTELKLSADRTI